MEFTSTFLTVTSLTSRLLGALFATTGVLHFTHTDAFTGVVPPVLGNARAWVWGSGVVELVVAALCMLPVTRRRGGALAFVTLLAVWPANIYAALGGGYQASSPVLASAWFAWLRVAFQIPLLLWARRVWRDG